MVKDSGDRGPSAMSTYGQIADHSHAPLCLSLVWTATVPDFFPGSTGEDRTVARPSFHPPSGRGIGDPPDRMGAIDSHAVNPTAEGHESRKHGAVRTQEFGTLTRVTYTPTHAPPPGTYISHPCPPLPPLTLFALVSVSFLSYLLPLSSLRSLSFACFARQLQGLIENWSPVVFNVRSRPTMSCNGCRVLRKGCSESCILRPCLQWIESAEAQGHATVFVAKFFGRAGLMSFISSVPEQQRPALFQSLLFEACGRTVNPVNGAVGLLWTGNWHVCQTAVETVLRGGTLRPLSNLPPAELDDASAAEESCNKLRDPYSRSKGGKRKSGDDAAKLQACELDLSLVSGFSARSSSSGGGGGGIATRPEKRRPATPEEEESVTTSVESDRVSGERRLLNLFV
ncbi:hypothetical protein H6P81_020655 [Aristolochia fimbriata]|uniref:LOB domain-containing protein n=1 Tax=Aristolochia fimbriata TaxID=158543 RepID=A0AAV7DV36_ARIFI|nr:hypothetical protein H6P81_020655 [Aristolochia fimbriata]